MDVADVLYSGHSQTVKLPDQYHIDTNQVYVNKIGDVIILTPVDKVKETFMSSFEMFSEDFMEEGRAEETVSKRETL